MSSFTDYYFWFAQPSSFLADIDKTFMYVFLGILVAAILLRLAIRFAIKHSVVKKLFMKVWRLLLTVGLSGVIWGIVRYESTPIFGRRYWAGLTILIGVIWLIFILKYLLFNFRKDKQEYDRERVKNKYIPNAR